jgi:hypothetical protein
MKKILVSLPKGVFDIVQGMKGQIGDSDSEVVRNIVISYLSEQGYFNTMGPIEGTPSSKPKKSK